MKEPKDRRRNPVTVWLTDEEMRELESACAPEGRSVFLRQAIRRHIELVAQRRRKQNTFAQNLIRRNEEGLGGKFSGTSFYDDEE